MLSVAVQKDIGEYEQKLFAGLTVRTSAALGLAVGLSCLEALVLCGLAGFEVGDIAIVIMASAMGVFFAGYAKPLGLPLEKSLPLILDARFGRTKLAWASSLALNRGFGDKPAKPKRDRDAKRRLKEYEKACAGRRERSPEVLLAAYAKAADDVLGTALVREERR